MPHIRGAPLRAFDLCAPDRLYDRAQPAPEAPRGRPVAPQDLREPQGDAVGVGQQIRRDDPDPAEGCERSQTESAAAPHPAHNCLAWGQIT